MPIYEYRCDKCNHVFESWQKMSDPNPDKCPECGADKIEKLISSTSFILQGGGWYATDYGGKTAHMPTGEKAAKEDAKRNAKKTADQAAAKAADTSMSVLTSPSSSTPAASSSSPAPSSSSTKSTTGE